MEIEALRIYFDKNQLPESQYLYTNNLLEELFHFEQSLQDKLSSSELLRQFIAKKFCEKETTIDFFIALMRYTKVFNHHENYILLTRYTGILDVIENIYKRFQQLHSREEFELVTKTLKVPSLGTPPEELPLFTAELMKRLNTLFSDEQVNEILTGNNHSLSEKSMLPEKLLYEEAPSLEVYLKERHQRKIDELTRHYQTNTVWFEQKITQEVIDYVASNQEILSAKLIQGKLYITKIPYDTLSYLNAKTDDMKRYHGCHCSFAKESIISVEEKIPGRWCYCSAGFAKFPFEIILGQKLPIKVLKNCLDGDFICRFEIDLEGVSYKK